MAVFWFVSGLFLVVFAGYLLALKHVWILLIAFLSKKGLN
ncbi:hypothetical protein AALB_2834 [Agarivorans albus MKT 106]|uniref:Uncharacterized protein n=1 Tax=Agarivorans albus MKT 106 TaxID=1331007 RepID=R9PN34_AGAAL|nr:hypothetical protein AALB_2834 [Agarivorans albus MKT 106]